jgi:hypothetical protein
MFPSGLLALLAAGTALAAPPALRLEITPAAAIEAALHFDIECPDLNAKEWIVYLPRLPELPGQTQVSSKMVGMGTPAEDLGPLRRPLLLARVPVRNAQQQTSLTVQVQYQATLQARELIALAADEKPPSVAALPDAMRKLLVAESPTLDFRAPAFRQWLKEKGLRRREREGDIDLARRVFRTIRRDFTYIYHPDLDRHASAVCMAGESDCGGLAVLFVGALRANDVPARLLIGRHAKSAEKGEQLGGVAYYQTHVKTEFFAAGIGWVPADPSARLTRDRSKNTAGLEFFGADPGDFLTLHVDMDLILDSLVFGRKSVPVLQGIAWWVKGQGSLEGPTVKEDWQVKTAAPGQVPRN